MIASLLKEILEQLRLVRAEIKIVNIHLSKLTGKEYKAGKRFDFM